MKGFSYRSTRRGLLKAGVSAACLVPLASSFALAQSQAGEKEVDISSLKPGQYIWQPELSPEGPVAVIVSLPHQICYVYRNGIRIGISTVSTGKAGYSTPTGVFTILQKAVEHHSTKYNEASMPFAERLTWDGVALHAGGLPGYPSSHGCVHLPTAFAKDLYAITTVGTPVIISTDATQPRTVNHPGMVLGQYAETEFSEAEGKLKNPPAPSGTPEESVVTSVIVSRADQSITILQNGKTVSQGKAYIKQQDQELGSHVFVLQGADAKVNGLSWQVIGYSSDTAKPATAADTSVIQRVSGDPQVIDAMKQRMHPGMILILTDSPAQPDSRSGDDFVVLDQAAGS